MKSTTFLIKRGLFFIAFFSSTFIGWGQFTTIASDPAGDGSNSSLLDGTKLEYKYDPGTDSLHFRVTVASISSTQASNFGVNVMINLATGSKFNFWGSSNKNTWSKLVTAWVTGAPPYSGTKGIANAQGVQSQQYTNLSSNNISIVMDQANNTITLGLKRSDLITNADMAGSNSITVRCAAAVGASNAWNDDIYNLTATMTLNNVVNSVASIKEGIAQVYPNPAQNTVSIILPESETPNTTISISDVLGKTQTLEATTNGNTLTVNTEYLANGVYWLNLTSTNGDHYREKLVIVK